MPAPLRPLALACLLACGAGTYAPAARAGNCNAADFTQLGNCISAAAPGDTVTITAQIVLSSNLPALPPGVTLLAGAGVFGGGSMHFEGGKFSATADVTLAPAQVFLGPGQATIAAATGTTLTARPTEMNIAAGTDIHFGSASEQGVVVLRPPTGVFPNAQFRLFVDGGTLRAEPPNTAVPVTSMRAQYVSVAAGATLDFNGGLGIITELRGAGTVTMGSGAGLELGVTRGDFTGSITGDGRLIKAGGAGDTLVLAGTNSYAGGTRIAAGTLRVGNGGTSGTLGAGNVVNDGNLVFDRSDTQTVANAISGSGTVTQAGTGTTILTGSNTYSGATTINAGMLQVGSGGTTGTLGTGAVTNNALLAFDRSDDIVAANNVSGSGRLVQNGTGTLTLSGNNTYSGHTHVNQGTLALTHGGASGTGAVVVGDARVRALDDMTLANQAVSFLENTAGTLAAATGKTLTVAGEVRIANGATARIGSATDNGVVVMAGGTGTIGVTSALQVAGGTLRAGGGTFATTIGLIPHVTVDAGATLDANDTSLTFQELQGAGVLLTGSNAATTMNVRSGAFDGVISGAGRLEKTTGATLVLTGDNTYTGSTTISSGTLRVGNGGTSGWLGSGSIVNHGTLAFDRGDSITLAQAISGTGGLAKAGTGALVLTAANSYSGPTEVLAGTLVVNGSIQGHTTVHDAATLGGTGAVGSVTVAAGGTLAPGNSIGTLTVNGDLRFDAGSTYRVESNAAGDSDKVTVTGASSVTIQGGTVAVQAGGGGYRRNTRYSIVRSAGPVTGAFSDVTTNLAFLAPTLVYQDGEVLLVLTSSDVSDYASAARTFNQRAVANRLQSFANAPANATAASLIQQVDNLTAEQARAAFDSMAGSPHASASQVALALGRNFSASLAARTGFSVGGRGNAMTDWSRTHYAVLADRHDPGIANDLVAQGARAPAIDASPGAQERGFWVQTLGSGGRIDSDGNGTGSRYRSNGFVFGYDQPVSGRWVAGGAVGYSRSWWDATSGTAASGRLESPQAGLYARYAADGWRLRLDASFADHEFTTDRTVAIGTASSVANSVHRGREWGVAAQAERAMQVGAWQFKPVAGIRHARLKEAGFSESGTSPANLAVAERTTQNTLLSAGVHFGHMFDHGKGGFELRALASHLAGDVDSPVTASIAGQAGSFTAKGAPLKRNALTLGASVSGQFTRSVGAYLDANYETRGSGQSAYRLTAGVRVAF